MTGCIKVGKKYHFFHLLRFLDMETTAKRAKQPPLPDIGEKSLQQYIRGTKHDLQRDVEKIAWT
jgi:hypothetical protein